VFQAGNILKILKLKQTTKSDSSFFANFIKSDYPHLVIWITGMNDNFKGLNEKKTVKYKIVILVINRIKRAKLELSINYYSEFS